MNRRLRLQTHAFSWGYLPNQKLDLLGVEVGKSKIKKFKIYKKERENPAGAANMYLRVAAHLQT